MACRLQIQPKVKVYTRIKCIKSSKDIVRSDFFCAGPDDNRTMLWLLGPRIYITYTYYQ